MSDTLRRHATLVLALLAGALLALLGQGAAPASAQAKDTTPRYQLVSGADSVYRIDVINGTTWRFQAPKGAEPGRWSPVAEK